LETFSEKGHNIKGQLRECSRVRDLKVLGIKETLSSGCVVPEKRSEWKAQHDLEICT
jgi:hypothetical protein